MILNLVLQALGGLWKGFKGLLPTLLAYLYGRSVASSKAKGEVIENVKENVKIKENNLSKSDAAILDELRRKDTRGSP